MEPWLIITLIVAGVIVLAILAWVVIALVSFAVFRKASREMDAEHEKFRRDHGFNNRFRNFN